MKLLHVSGHEVHSSDKTTHVQPFPLINEIYPSNKQECAGRDFLLALSSTSEPCVSCMHESDKFSIRLSQPMRSKIVAAQMFMRFSEGEEGGFLGL